MSFDALAWAAKQRTGSAGTKLVLLGLAECADRTTSRAFPSIAALVEFSDLNRKSVIANLDRLEAAGFIRDTGEKVGRTGQIKIYELQLATVPKVEQSQKRNSSVYSIEQSQKRDTDTVREPVIPQKATPSSVARAKPTRVPSNFTPAVKPDSITGKAMAGWPPGYLAEQIEHFIDHHTVKGTLSLDWQASWRTWVKQGKRFNGQSGTNRMAGSGKPAGRTSDGFINAIRDARAIREAVPWDANDTSGVPRLAGMG